MTLDPATNARLPFDIDDLYLHRKVVDAHCASGGVAACTVRRVDRANNRYVSRIWLFPFDGTEPREATQGPGSSDASPRWSADGRHLAFISDRAGHAPQAYVLEREGGEARQITHFEQSVSSPRWHPDGRRLFVAVAVPVDPERRGERSAEPAAPRGTDAPEVAWRLPYKEDGLGYLLGREIHLFGVDIHGGKPLQLTDGAFDVLAHDISPDGRHIAYTRSREGRFAHASDLWICDVEGQGHERCTFGHAIVMQPAWSPDGRWIAFTGALEDGDAEPRLWLHDRESRETRALGDVDVADPLSLTWLDDGRSLLFVRAHRGRHQVVRLDVPHGRHLEVLVAGDRQFGAFSCDGERMVFGPECPSMASELHACRLDGADERRISDLNGWWGERTPIVAEIRGFDVPDGRGGSERIEGWLMHAEGAVGPMPLLNDIHGGPASYALVDFDTNVFWQVLCSRGWAVLALNAVGSSSYGHEFCRRLAGHWGELDMPQHLAAIAQLRAEGLCDERVAVSGKSYGGYLSGWATGHTDVFRAAVVMAPVGNIETHYGTSDGGYYADPFYLASQPRFDRERARRLSPLQHIEKSRTPTLFLQGKDDERCPKCQSEELFVSLARAGDTPTELVLYPGETHGFLGSGKPACRQDAAQRIVDWIARHCVSPSGTRRYLEAS